MDNNVAYELYGVSRPNDPTLFPNNNDVEVTKTDTLWHAAQETVWNMNTNTFRTLGATSADAAGLSILAGLVRPDEGLPVSEGGQGAIDHALRFTLPSGDVNPQYIYPASHMVSESQATTKLPFGARLRLADTPTIDALNREHAARIASHCARDAAIRLDPGRHWQRHVRDRHVSLGECQQPDQSRLEFGRHFRQQWAGETYRRRLSGPRPDAARHRPQCGQRRDGEHDHDHGAKLLGAAGHLSVLFGTTPAPTVAYVSDTQITAVVPAGSGTVNVIVQSGTNETDNVSDNPNANINAPIFGYGTSAVTTADKFTFAAGLPGDANHDGIVNAQDIGLVSSNWLTHGPVGDLNSDGVVNTQDLALITASWLATTGNTANAMSVAAREHEH